MHQDMTLSQHQVDAGKCRHSVGSFTLGYYSRGGCGVEGGGGSSGGR